MAEAKKKKEDNCSYFEESQIIDKSTTCGVGTKVISFGEDDNTAKVQIKKARKIPASLVLLVGPSDIVGQAWMLEENIVTIGRSTRLADIMIGDNSISKAHFQIQKEDDKIYVVDLKSTNKTYVDNVVLKPYAKHLLKDNSQIRLGNVILKFLEKGNLEIFYNQQVLNRSHVDSLTGLSNRAALKIQGPEFFRSGEEFCIIALDIDYFKKINDTHGHLAGDFVLKKVSEKIKQLIRSQDIAFRYGGEEFCIFMLSSYDATLRAARRICSEVSKCIFHFKGKDITLTLSLGVSVANNEDQKWQDVYNRADKFLYQAKNLGRNRVVSEEDRSK